MEEFAAKLDSPARLVVAATRKNSAAQRSTDRHSSRVTFISLLLSHPGFLLRHSETSLPEKLRLGECERSAPQRAGLPRLAASEELGGSDTAERICGIRDASAAAGPGGRRVNPRWNSEFEWRRRGMRKLWRGRRAEVAPPGSRFQHQAKVAVAVQQMEHSPFGALCSHFAERKMHHHKNVNDTNLRQLK